MKNINVIKDIVVEELLHNLIMFYLFINSNENYKLYKSKYI